MASEMTEHGSIGVACPHEFCSHIECPTQRHLREFAQWLVDLDAEPMGERRTVMLTTIIERAKEALR